MRTEFKYFAFISYSHKDSELAKWLQHEFEYYKLPSVINGRKLEEYEDLPKSFRPLFRDEDELAGGVYKPQIHEALASSQYLIVVCSPNSAGSDYVNDEIKEFISLSGDNKRKIFPFIVDGKPHAKKVKNEKECFPKALLELSEDKEDPIELIAGDVNATGKDHAFVKILAGTLKEKDIQFSDLWNRYEVEKAEKERIEREQRDKLLITQSHYLAEKSILCHEEGDNYLAQLLALEALPRNVSDPNDRPYVLEAEVALRKSCATRSSRLKGHLAKINCIAISSNGHLVASASDDKTIKLWDVESGKNISTINVKDSESIMDLFFSIDDKLLIAHSSDRSQIYRFWSLDNQLCSEPKKYTPKIGEIILTKNGESFIVQHDGKISGTRVFSNVLTKVPEEYPKDSIFLDKAIYANKNIVFSITKSSDEPEVIFSFSCDIEKIKCFSKKPLAVCKGENNHVYILDLINKTILWEYNKCVGAISDIAIDPEQRFIAISCYDKSVHVFWMSKYPIDRKILGFKQLYAIGDYIIAHNESNISVFDLVNNTGGCIYEGEITDFYVDESQFMLYTMNRGEDSIKVIDLESNEVVFSTSIFALRVRYELDLPGGLYIKNNRSYIYNYDNKISILSDDNNIKTICETKYSFGGIMMSPSLDYVLVIICNIIYVIDSNSFEIINVIDACKQKITAIDVSSDGNLVVFGSSDIPILLWDKNNNKIINCDSTNISSSLDFVAFSPDDKNIIATFEDNSVIIFKISDNTNQVKIHHKLRHQTIDYFMHNFTKKAISPDSKYVLAGHHKGLPGLDVIDIERGCKVASFNTNDLCVKSAFFTEENNHIVAELEGGVFLIYEFPLLQDLINVTTQKYADRPLSMEEKVRFYLN